MPKVFDNRDIHYVKRRGHRMTGTAYKNMYLQDGEGIIDNIKALFFGRTKLPPDVRKILKQHGDTEIDYIQVARNPLNAGTKLMLNVASLGEFSRKAKKLPYDRLFHLYMIVTLKDGKNILIEKNEVINMEMKGVRKDAESRLVPVNKKITLNTVMANTKKRMGKHFLPYNAYTNNCQDLLMNILKANNLGDGDTYKFVKQNTSSIFKDSPIFAGIAKFATDLGAKVDILKKGAGLSKNQKEMMKQHSQHHTHQHLASMTKLMKQGKSFQESHDITMNKVGAGIISPHAEHNIKAFFDGIGKPSPYAENYKRYIQGGNLSAPRGGNVFEDFLGSYFSGKLPPRKQHVLGEKGINKAIEFNVNRF